MSLTLHFLVALSFFLLDALIDFLAVNRHILGRVDPKSYLITFHTEDCYGDVVTNYQGLANSSG